MKTQINKLLFLFIISGCLFFGKSTYAANYADCRTGTLEEDSLQLVILYNALDGPNWTLNTWNLNQPVATWPGVSLSSDGTQVDTVSRYGDQLNGTIPNITLPGLKRLSLSSSDNITGTIPDFDLPNLEELYIVGTNVTGSLPDFDLPNLKKLIIYSNELLTGSIPNFDLPNLEELNLHNNDHTGDIPDFNLPNLIKINITNNEQLAGTLPSFNLPNLQELLLYYNALTGNIPDFNLPNLIIFDASYNQFTGTIPDFNLPSLQVLYLRSNQLSGAIPDFSNLGSVEELYLYLNQFSGSIPNFSNLPLLKKLNLSRNQLTGSIPDFNLPLLEWLALYENQLNGSVPDFSAIPALTILDIRKNQLSGAIPNFSNLPVLKRFSAETNELNGSIPDFSNIPDLDYLDLSNNNFTGNIPDFSNLSLLETLNINDNFLSGSIPDFSGLPVLDVLDLTFNNLTGSIPDFSNLPVLRALFVSNNLLEGNLPDFLSCPGLQLVYLEFNNFDGPLPDWSHLNDPSLGIFLESNNLSGCFPSWICNANYIDLVDNPGLPAAGDEVAIINFCNNPSSQFGLLCDDGNPMTIGESIQPDCSCSLDNSLTNVIKGKIFMDSIENCSYDTAEIALQNWIVSAVSNDATYYGVSDSLGNYQVYTDSGEYVLQVVIPHAYWNICPGIQGTIVNFQNPEDSLILDVPLLKDYTCPLLNVDISTTFLRRCFDNTYVLSYCNEGTAIAENAYIEVTFDDYLVVNSSTPPWTSQNGQTFTYDIGTVDISACGSFEIDVTVDCDSTVNGQTHCTEAHIYPDSICLPENTLWDGSTIELDATCEGDSIKFYFRNVGDNDMSEPANYIIIVDDLILRTGSFIIPSGGIDSTAEEATGGTFYLLAEQSPYHPTNSAPSLSVEGCVIPNEPFTTGFVTIYAEDDADPFISIDCQQNIGSFDPNDKIGYPVGLGPNHLIDSTTTLEYRIRFQNTGTDTAFTVILRDTLSEFLNPATIRMGVASHPYEWEILDSNVLQVVYDNILLPDSSANEVASHGFIKFKIDQQENNFPGTLITNSAGIYFDYNVPVITNTTTHYIEEKLIAYDTVYYTFCDHWFYNNDTVFDTHSVFGFYELFLTTVITIAEPILTTIDLTFVGSGIYQNISYENDTTLFFTYTAANGCDSLVTVNIDIILSNISKEDLTEQIHLFPNPAEREVFLYLNLTSLTAVQDLKIYNQIGQRAKVIPIQLEFSEGEHIIPVDISDLPKGIYSIGLNSPQFNWTQKIIIQ